MKTTTSTNVLEKIDGAKERIKELQTMINHWEGNRNTSYWDTECSTNPSSPQCLLFNE
tara:strand:+ start:1600 stop:1773 length:174 start_codon:yes stop_codon:yes gene_type:complete